VKGDFRENTFPELRKCRNELHTTRGRKRKVRIFEPSQGFDTPLRMPLKNSRFSCRSRTRYPQLLKAAVHTFVADERVLDGPRDLTGKTTAQIGLYVHLYKDKSKAC
jgi:hypothetical protein